MTSLEVRDIALELRGRRARDGTRRPFDGLSVEAADGEAVAVTGPSGFGGTTLARLVAGILSPDSGSVLVDGVDVTDQPAGRRPVGLVPVGGGLLPHLTAEENIVYGLRLRRESRPMIRHRLEGASERLELHPSLSLRPHELSAGQRMRVALARATVRPSRVLVVDATAGWDGIGQLRDLIDRARGDAAMSVLLCTADLAVIGQADRVVLVRDGRAA